LPKLPASKSFESGFDQPQDIAKIRLLLRRNRHLSARSLPFLVAGGTIVLREVVRQQFNFSPPNTTQEQRDFSRLPKKAEA
jgi:hypothetical protein